MFKVLDQKKYFRLFTFVFFLSLFFVLVLNCFLDPLWHLKGNIFTKKNFAFNERVSKINLFSRSYQDYNCIVLGSSRSTLIPAHRIKGKRCFNFGVSAASVEEMYQIAQYIDRVFKFKPKYVYIELSVFNVQKNPKPKNRFPDYVKNFSKPPFFLAQYLSSSVLDYSIRTLKNRSPLPRYYDENFVCRVRIDAPEYRPRDPVGKISLPVLSSNRILELIEFYKGADVILIRPPLSYERLNIYKNPKKYLRVFWSLTPLVKAFYDFSAPSKITRSHRESYDGLHFHEKANQLLVMRLNGVKSESFGLSVHEMDFESYLESFL